MFAEKSVCAFSPEMLEMLQLNYFCSDRFLGGRASGETALKWAALVDGLGEYWKLAADPYAHASAEFQEEEGWILADNTEWPYSFVNLCKEFGLDPVSVRNMLVAWKSHAKGA